jgi:hypothetical protein
MKLNLNFEETILLLKKLKSRGHYPFIRDVVEKIVNTGRIDERAVTELRKAKEKFFSLYEDKK